MARQVRRFFEIMDEQRLTVTYGEVRLQTMYSGVLPANVSTETRFSRHVGLKIPVISAAMDTVTESRMAITMAKLGGIGVIHKNLDPLLQRKEVRKVKFHLSGRISTPITVTPSMTLEEVENMRQEKEFGFHSFPVIDDNGKLVGVIAKDDFDFAENYLVKVGEVMSTDLLTALPETNFDEALALMQRSKKKILPLINPDGSLAGMYLHGELKSRKSGSRDMFNMDDQGRLRVAAAIGVGGEAMERVALLAPVADVIVIDTAHGDSASVLQTIREIKSRYSIDVVAGNVSQGPSAFRLVEAGADGIKVGQGPGSICTTRIVAGVGCPQVSAIGRAAASLEDAGYGDVPICADGGIENSGDIPIALGAGAHNVMLGKLLAGTTEAPGEVILYQGRSVKFYRGMGSLSAMEQRRESRERYLQGDVPGDKLVPEGVESHVPFTGDVATVMHQFIGGLRAGMAYVGAETIERLREIADFDRMSSAGAAESHPHGVEITREAPNYRRRS